MSRMMIQAAITMNQLQSKLDLIGNNLANSQTTGYKSRQAEFSSLLFQQINNLSDQANTQGRLTPDGLRIGSGARLGSINTDLSIGSLTETGRPLDVALLEEDTFFQIEVTENGRTETQYTRDGSFYLNPIDNSESLLLTTKDGHPVLSEGGTIRIVDGFDSIDIQSNGQILVQRGNQTEIVGNLDVVTAVRPRILQAAGENSFRLPNLEQLGYNLNEVIQSENSVGNILKSGSLEYSNVDIAKQMTDMIMTQRAYQFNARTISMSDQMSGLINTIRT